MPILAREVPRSFEVQEFLLSLKFDDGRILSLLDPERDGSGRGSEIFYSLRNIPVTGLTFQPTPNRSNLGFVHAQDCSEQKDDPNRFFDSEAVLVLDTASIQLPKEFDGLETWVIQVKDQANEDLYAKVGEALMKQFGVNIVLTSASVKRADHKEEGVPVDPKYPDGATYCPIGVTRVTTTAPKKKAKK
jgi:hypothetical protein